MRSLFLVAFIFSVISCLAVQQAFAASSTCTVYQKPDTPFTISKASACTEFTYFSLINITTASCVSYNANWKLGEACTKNSECRSDSPFSKYLSCYAGKCQYGYRNNGEACDVDDQCVSGHCDTDAKKCRASKAGENCLPFFSSCESGTICAGNLLALPTCQAPNKAKGAACYANAFDAITSDNTGKKQTSDCQSGLVCRKLDGGSSTTCQDSGSAVGDSCSVNTDCVRADGTYMYCDMDKKCANQAVQVGETCKTSDVLFPKTATCVYGSGCNQFTNKCVQYGSVKEGDSCASSEECANGLYCKGKTLTAMGTCTKPPAPTSCNKDDDCGENGFCVCKNGDESQGGQCVQTITPSYDATYISAKCFLNSCGNLLTLAGYPYDRQSCRFGCSFQATFFKEQQISAIRQVQPDYMMGQAAGLNAAAGVRASATLLVAVILAAIALAL